jgi:hypothetical protein
MSETEAAADAAATTPEEAPAPAWPKKIALKKPIVGLLPDGAKIEELSLREPTAKDIEVCGNPCRPNWETGEVTFDEKKMSAIIAQLSNVPPPFISKLDPRDWTNAAWRVHSFFLPDLAMWR